MKGTVHLQVYSGLGCRLRCVLAAVTYTQRSGKSLHVNWLRKDKSQTLGTFDVSLNELWRGPYEVTNKEGNWGAKLLTPKDELAAALDTDGDVWIRTDTTMAFGCPDLAGCLQTHLTPTSLLANRTAALMKGLPRPIIGLHFRDAVMSRSRAPDLNWYVDQLREMPEWPVYLCTDTPEMANAVRERLGDRVLIAEREDDEPVGTYNRAGIIQVAAELYVLAACDWVFGSRGSTYSELVALMRGAEKIGRARDAKRMKANLTGGRYADEACGVDTKALAEVIGV